MRALRDVKLGQHTPHGAVDRDLRRPHRSLALGPTRRHNFRGELLRGRCKMKIVQMSDIHVGSGLFRPDLLSSAIEETNSMEPDLVAVVGDLTTEGYRWEFEEAKEYLDRLECEHVVVAMGNHDARSVGYRHFEELFGMRERAVTVPVPEGEAKILVLDSEFRDWNRGPTVLLIHHHILAVPGTGRDVNILHDSGDVMAILRDLRVDVVLSGHRHVPYVWSISGVRI